MLPFSAALVPEVVIFFLNGILKPWTKPISYEVNHKKTLIWRFLFFYLLFG